MQMTGNGQTLRSARSSQRRTEFGDNRLKLNSAYGTLVHLLPPQPRYIMVLLFAILSSYLPSHPSQSDRATSKSLMRVLQCIRRFVCRTDHATVIQNRGKEFPPSRGPSLVRVRPSYRSAEPMITTHILITTSCSCVATL